MNCPGSIALSEGLPNKSSVYAQEGTAAHEVVEATLAAFDKGRPATAADMIGEFVTVDHDEDGTPVMMAVTEEMATAAQECIDHVIARYEELIADYDEVHMYLERQFDLGPLNPPEPMFGTADITMWVPSIKHIEVIDYKHGQGVVVEVEENSQIMMYGLGATVSQGTIPNTIRVTIVQPRAPHHDGTVRSYDFGRDRLIEFKNELFAAAEATQDPDAPLAVGDWCKFCPAKVGCPAQKTHAVDLATVEFDVQPVETLESLLPVPGTLTPTEVSNIVARAGIMMDWLRDMESHALTLMQEGVNVPGFKLVAGRSNRRWKDADEAEKYLARQGLKKAERTTAKVISPAQAEKKMKAGGKDPKRLERLWEKPEGTPKLAPVEDNRPELPRSVDADFFPTTDTENAK